MATKATNQLGVQSPTRKNGSFVLDATVDFSLYPLAGAEVMPLFYIPAGTRVQRIEATVVTAQGAASTIDVGDYTESASVLTAVDADGWIDGLNANSAARTGSDPTLTVTEETNVNSVAWSPAYWTGKTYTTASVIGIVIASGADPVSTAKIRFQAMCVDLI